MAAPDLSATHQTVLRASLRIVIYREEVSWIAHCLEFDLLGDSDSRSDALKRPCEAISLQIDHAREYKNWRNLFRSADGKFFEMYAAGRDITEATVKASPLENLRSSFPMIQGLDAREYGETRDAELAIA